MENSPYSRLIDKEKVKVDFKTFYFHVEGRKIAKNVRQQKNWLNNFTANQFLNRVEILLIAFFFRLSLKKMRFKSSPDTMKYFCQSENCCYYLQK